MKNCSIHFTTPILILLFIFPVKTLAKESKQQDLRSRVSLALNRLGYGPRPGEVEQITKGGEKALKAWTQAQLNPELIKDSDLEAHLAKYPILQESIEELQKTYSKDGAEDNPLFKPDEIRKAWYNAKLVRAIESRKQFQEKLTAMWFNHFNVDQRKGKLRWYFGPYERDAIRPHIFGKFLELLRATARHPAMLFYLDNHLSRAEDKKNQKGGGLNENYGRELLELHTLGVHAGYNQNDVREAARILTGWSISNPNDQPVFEFKTKWHDDEAKKVLSWDFPAGDGETEGERLLQLLARHPATAKRVAELIAVHFVSDPAPPLLVALLARVYEKTDGDLKAMYRALLDSKEFWQRHNSDGLIKDHFDWTISAIRVLGGEVLWQNQLQNEINKFGEPIYQCAPPTGYMHRPDELINSGTIVSRLNLALRLAANRIDGVYVTIPQYTAATTNSMTRATPIVSPSGIKTPGQVVDFLRTQLALTWLSPSTTEALLSELRQSNWQLEQDQVRPFILARLVGLLLASPEFQRIP